MPKYRKELYAVWRACERFRILPPGVDSTIWDESDVWAQAQLIAYDQIRQIEDAEHQANMVKASYGSRTNY